MDGRADGLSKEFGAAARDLFRFTAFSQFLERVRPYRLEQPPSTVGRRPIQCDQRLGDQIGDLVEDYRRGVTLIAHYGVCCFKRETRGENTQAAQQAPFRSPEQVIAPVERPASRLMSRQSGSTAAGQPSEAPLQAGS